MEHKREVRGFLKASGKKVINGEGQEIVLRGVGFGSWLLPEGYMWRFPDQGDRPRRIERLIADLVGETKAAEFWELYYDRYTAEADIQKIASEGFNSVRVPISARFLIEEGEPLRVKEGRLQLLDRVIEWCRKYSLYVILDLHGAPGGQTGTNIDDSENDKPELFMDERNKRLTVALWRMLADRYQDEWIVAGYDLLNEPLPDWFSAYNDQVMPLYKEIVEAIREVDNRHMIILEGAHWATDWSIFDEKIDDNLMLQFHKYWNNPDTESIQLFLDKREEWNVPIFMGEGGENNCDWFAGVFRLYEDHDISWNFWTWKKLDCTNSPCSVIMPNGWRLLVDYLEGGAKPDAKLAERILWEYLDNLSIERCLYRPEVVNALFRRPPVRIPAIFYGYKGGGTSFSIGKTAEKNIGFRVNDGMDIRFVESEREKPNFQHMKGEEWQPDELMYIQLAPNDWVAYEFTVTSISSTTDYTLDMRLRMENYGSVAVCLNGVLLGTSGMKGNDWHTVRLRGKFQAKEGINRLVLMAADLPASIQWLHISPV
ncbi:glycoside hydrolase family 5 protein [Paenibacillus prosopidis]|uniref:Cellulase (Glycosyl hydrolase family 5) n=1 Tax=Paenibacillus prosopidis TaxID=630520 RepID=A0A368W9P5_9BACL|nr:glycoside hydrolase family 5 protein [Paenibacillus prosopidis]RCW50256.1 cellulase (glycosyl hydrolase family 5) [Paenibacillus prosopidis]